MQPNRSEQILSHRKEKHFKESYTLYEVVNNDPKRVVELRIYVTPSQSYAVIWGNEKHTQGTTGVGKDLYTNDAAQHAIFDAFTKNNSYMKLPSDPTPQTNLEAIAAYLQVKNHFIHHAHA